MEACEAFEKTIGGNRYGETPLYEVAPHGHSKLQMFCINVYSQIKLVENNRENGFPFEVQYYRRNIWTQSVLMMNE